MVSKAGGRVSRMRRGKIHHSVSDRIYYAISGVFLVVLLLIVAYPLIFVVSSSFSSGNAVSSGRVVLLPVEFSLRGYEAVFHRPDIWSSYANTLCYTVVGTLINVSMAIITAYPLSRADLKGRGVLMFIFAFTMYFSGGMIPNYLLVNSLGLIDTIGAMVLPGALSVYNMIVMRSFIQSNIPLELQEAAGIDGCSDFRFLWTMVIPLSKAVIAVVALFSAVGHWNSYFNAMIYLNTRSKLPLQIILREILIMNQVDFSLVSDPELILLMANMADVLKYALIVVATVPILLAYPFAQKYFVKGVMIGSLKG